MTTAREAFEAYAGAMGFALTRLHCAAPEPWSEYLNEATGYLWAGWQAGRDSMREEIEHLPPMAWFNHYVGAGPTVDSAATAGALWSDVLVSLKAIRAIK